jgi:hypothetical protein
MASGDAAWIARGATSEKIITKQPVNKPLLRIFSLLGLMRGFRTEDVPDDGRIIFF